MKKTRLMMVATLCYLGWPFNSAFSQVHADVHSQDHVLVPQLTLRTLRPDAQPAIDPNAEILIFIHGMDSRAEEADDLTKNLFMAIGTPPGSQAPPPPNSNIAVLNQLLQKYQNCILEKYETQQDMLNRGLPADDSGLTSTAGLMPVGAVQCLDGSQCAMTSRMNTFIALQAQANRGDPQNFQTQLESAIPTDCFQCAKHQEMHTKQVHCTMEAGGNSGLITGPKFELCKAGVDITGEAGQIVQGLNDAFNNLTNPSSTVPDVTGGATIATNHTTVTFGSCGDPAKVCAEVCDPEDLPPGGAPGDPALENMQTRVYFEPLIPTELLDTVVPAGATLNVPPAHNLGLNEGRLRLDLRTAAQLADPRDSLTKAAISFGNGDPVVGNAFADLSVTGHRSFSLFRADPPQEAFCQSLPTLHSEIDAQKLLTGCRTALTRAYRVANFLRTGQRGDTPALKSAKDKERNALGWIAVSGEDDSPHRPVNVMSSDFPQYDLVVNVEAPMAPGTAPLVPCTAPMMTGAVLMAPGTVKCLPVHTRYTIAQFSTPAGKNLVVISVDLPTSGYADNIDYNQISALSDIGSPKVGLDFQATGKTPILDFIESFIVRFVETLHKTVPIKNDIKVAMGGSLGGNMAFRLGRRPNTTWLPKVVVWSPASIWTSLAEGSDITKHIAVSTAWNSTAKPLGGGDRAAFFQSWDTPLVPLFVPPQADTWTSDYYLCKKSDVARARFDRQETFDLNFLAWHWRLATEQLIFSHQSIDSTTGQPRYMSNTKPMLLACGLEDRIYYNDICPATQTAAAAMTLTPGKALFLDKTGHSLDNERHNFWAMQVIQFLGL